jgi:hypothetical protein
MPRIFDPGEDIFSSPQVDELLQREAPPNTMAALQMADRAATQQQPQQPGPNNVRQALNVIMPMFAIGQMLGGNARAGGATLGGYQAGREQAAIEQRRAEQIELQRRQQERLEQQELEQREAIKRKLVMDTAALVRGVKTRDEYEEIIGQQESIASMFLGMRPNAIRSAVPYRAPGAPKLLYDAIDGYLKNPLNKPMLESGRASEALISVDLHGDGAPPRALTLGQAIAESGYPVLLDPQTQKPLLLSKPITAQNVQPFDLAFRGLVDRWRTEKGRDPTDAERGELAIKASRSLDRPPAAPVSTATDRRQARSDAQSQARDRLYAAILEGGDEKALAAQFAGPFSAIGLSYRAEAARIRRELFTAGSQGLSDVDREAGMTPAAVIDRGREVLGGAEPAPAPVVGRLMGESTGQGQDVHLPSGQPTAPPAPAGRGGRPGLDWPKTTDRNDYVVLRSKAQAVLDAEAQRRGLPPGSVTEEQIAKFLKNPANRKRLQGR